MIIIYLGIGTNLGDREANLREALRLLDERGEKQLACSSVYRSAPQGFVSENEFANIVAIYETNCSSEELLHITQQIEREMGRTQKSHDGIHYDRVIDIDLLKAYEGDREIVVQTPTLSLPHPRMEERDFVMVPLHEAEAIFNSLITKQ